MAVAAAIGVGADEAMEDAPGGRNNTAVHLGNGRTTLAQRLSNKMNHHGVAGGASAVLGEINRSIEKMSLTNANGNVTSSYGMPPSVVPPQGRTGHPQPPMDLGQQTTLLNDTQTANAPRRGSDWTNSTEGYGSLRSEQSMMGSSRRCSDVSAMSQVC